MLNGSEDYEKLLPQYRYSKIGEFRTTLTDEEIKIFMGLLFAPESIFYRQSYHPSLNTN